MASTSMLTPSTSEVRMNSCRFCEHIWPVRVSQSIAIAHSACGRLDVAHEAVQVLDQRLHDLPQARIGNVLPALERDVGQVVFGHVGHGCLLQSRGAVGASCADRDDVQKLDKTPLLLRLLERIDHVAGLVFRGRQHGLVGHAAPDIEAGALLMPWYCTCSMPGFSHSPLART